MKRGIYSLKGAFINQLQYDLDNRGFSSTKQNTNTIIDAMESQTKNIMEERVRKTEVITSKVAEGSGTNGSNIIEIVIEEEEEE